jgi:hypothetical protein
MFISCFYTNIDEKNKFFTPKYLNFDFSVTTLMIEFMRHPFIKEKKKYDDPDTRAVPGIFLRAMDAGQPRLACLTRFFLSFFFLWSTFFLWLNVFF